MALITSNGTVYAAPRVIQTQDTRAGCPGTAANGSVLISQTFTVSNPCVYWTHGRIIFNAASRGWGRADFVLAINGSGVKNALDACIASDGTYPNAWEELDATYNGTLGAGTHTITVVGSNGANCWGCGTPWGEITTVVWEAG